MVLVEALAGAVLGLLTLWLVLRPLSRPAELATPIFEPIDPEETPKGIALAALKEIEFDRETGKLSDADYEFLKTKYTATALEALRSEAVGLGEAARLGTPVGGATCPRCGPRPEPDALFCSSCGQSLPRQAIA